MFTLDPETVRAQYRRLPDFLSLRDRLDAGRKFANPYTDHHLGT